MGNIVSVDIVEPLDQYGLQASANEMPILQQRSNTTSLFIGAGNFPGNELNATGIFLSGGTFQGPSPFTSVVPKKFQNNIEQQTFTYVISTESEKSSLISNLAEISGHYGGVEGSASLSFVNKININQTSLSVFKYAHLSLGNVSFDFSNQKLSDNVVSLLDPTLEHNKNPEHYVSNVKTFLSTYGHYYISSYQLQGELLASWEITTISKKDKQEIGSNLSGKVTGGEFDFSAVNNFISKISESFSQSSTTFRSIGIGVKKNIQTIEQLNAVFNDFLSSVDQTTAKISKIFISPWISLSQVAAYISKITDQKVQEEVVALLNGPNLTQDIWNRILRLQSSILSLRDRMQNTVDDPYNYDFWGFLTNYNSLPLSKIKTMITQLNTLLDALNTIDEKDYAASFFTFQKTEVPTWEQLQKEYLQLTRTPTYTFHVKTGYFSGMVTGPLSGYDITQGTTADGIFDPSTTQINSPIYVGPSLQRPGFFAISWQQGVMNFIKTNQSDKRTNPFAIELECRLAWTAHLNWDSKKEIIFFMPDQKQISAAAVYDTTLNSIPLRGIMAAIVTERPR